MARTIAVGALGICLGVLIGCAIMPLSNPLLGSWEMDAKQSDPVAVAGQAMASMFTGSKQVEFSRKRMITGGKSQEVSYDVNDGRIIVTAVDGEGTVFTVLDENHVSFKGTGGTLVLKRLGTP